MHALVVIDGDVGDPAQTPPDQLGADQRWCQRAQGHRQAVAVFTESMPRASIGCGVANTHAMQPASRRSPGSQRVSCRRLPNPSSWIHSRHLVVSHSAKRIDLPISRCVVLRW
jgi:hypothetical protein